jgi:FixJ family two-component response regulator
VIRIRPYAAHAAELALPVYVPGKRGSAVHRVGNIHGDPGDKSLSEFLVAVVEDDQNMLESLESLLESSGYAVLLYSCGEDLLSSDRLADINCLISDIGLPGMDGIDLLGLVLASRADLPVFIITANHKPSSLAAALNAGARQVFLKPLNNAALLNAIAAVR